MNNMVNVTRWQPAVEPTYTPVVPVPVVPVVPRLPNLDDVRGIVSRTLSRARGMGRDDLTQTRAAALAVLAVRPDLTLAQALSGIARMQASGAV